MAAVKDTEKWLENLSRRKLNVKQLTREVLVEFIDRIFVYPYQKIDIYFKFASEDGYAEKIIQKDGVV